MIIKNKIKEYHLNFISDHDIYNHVKDTVLKYRLSMNFNEFNKNLVDPIKLTFDSKIYKIKLNDLIEQEVIRQIDKSNTNHIGYFHQNIFKYINKEWTVPKTGYDIINEKNCLYVEIKNKHNTMNSSSSKSTYIRMQNTILKTPQSKCFLVEVIAKSSQNIPWKTSIDSINVSDDRIRRISIDKFYELVTENKYAFKILCEKLPIIIEDVVNNEVLKQESNSIFKELKKLDDNLMKSLYLLTFKKYEGFGNEFNI